MLLLRDRDVFLRWENEDVGGKGAGGEYGCGIRSGVVHNETDFVNDGVNELVRSSSHINLGTRARRRAGDLLL